MEAQIAYIFDPEKFYKSGKDMLDVLTQYLKDIQQDTISVNQWMSSSDLSAQWTRILSSNPTFKELVSCVIDHSIHLHHPHYIGHQVSAPAPQVAVVDMMVSLLNNGMGVYEMGASGSIIEKIMVDRFCQSFGYQTGSGFFTSGGTLANLTVMLAARQSKGLTDIWEEGADLKLALIVSEQAHYCVDRAARIMGWGSKGIIKIPVDDDYKMRTELIPDYISQAEKEGVKVIAIVGSAPSTSTGKYDDLERIASYAEEYNLWFHVDAAHGGPAIFSGKYKALLKGCERADSIILDTHKMMLTSALATAVLFKNAEDSFSAFHTKAHYLWEDSQEYDWDNLAQRTFECTKQMIALRVFFLWQLYGVELFDQHVTYLFDLARKFGTMIDADDDFEMFLKPDSNIICFRWVAIDKTDVELDEFNQHLRRTVLEDGQYYIVQTVLNNRTWLRLSLMNPLTTEAHLDSLISYLKQKAKEISAVSNT